MAKKISDGFWNGLFGGVLGGALIILLVWWFGWSGTSVGTFVSRQETVTLNEDSAIINTVSKITPSVVSILSSRNVISFFGEFEQQGAGTGFIISKNGLIATNKHVVESEDAEYTVITSDGERHDAKVVAVDKFNDLALIKIPGNNLPVADLGNSDEIQVGQRVVAIGNALGEYQNTVTAGVISAVGRTIIAGSLDGTSEKLNDLIQTDAAINPGNSGGPLVNLVGQIIGINTAIDVQGSQIGFAIPINAAKSAIDSYLSVGRIVRPMLGIRYLDITKDLVAIRDLSVTKGALIVGGENGQLAVTPNGPADRAGIKEGDIIIAIDNEEIDESKGIISILRKYKPGDAVKINLLRGSRKLTVSAKLGELK
ncbi:MAG: trypsin-like peptidase domain-containing protein [Patescibacteria group bacterium]|nr:trypsin-like peptidase domain-containing protein [Patescibacteria group bacterium]